MNGVKTKLAFLPLQPSQAIRLSHGPGSTQQACQPLSPELCERGNSIARSKVIAAQAVASTPPLGSRNSELLPEQINKRFILPHYDRTSITVDLVFYHLHPRE
jgi:hypothetical protein